MLRLYIFTIYRWPPTATSAAATCRVRADSYCCRCHLSMCDPFRLVIYSLGFPRGVDHNILLITFIYFFINIFIRHASLIFNFQFFLIFNFYKPQVNILLFITLFCNHKRIYTLNKYFIFLIKTTFIVIK